ncbi:hypothetical protein FHS07_001992 [Microbacterium proteolyticum]|uniref:Uncharacterized protein n=1 Tax=Microbacterium proteolyticum TaxID=1572644 RepID=A0A7W5CIH8_9MICO|nr:hypothetical protein [Microbacterium proteolyticum]MBB3158296.1 hypothetical protein [Microbacterium proteolyticum]
MSKRTRGHLCVSRISDRIEAKRKNNPRGIEVDADHEHQHRRRRKPDQDTEERDDDESDEDHPTWCSDPG